MKLAWKIALVIAVGMCAALVFDGYLRVQRQITLFETDIRRDHLAMGRATAVALTEAWQTGGESLAEELLQRMTRKKSKVTIRWFRVHTEGENGLPGHLPGDVRRAIESGREASYVNSSHEIRRLYTYIPVMVDNAPVRVIELRESLAQQSVYVRRTIVRTVAVTGIVMLLTVGIIFALGITLVGRPVRTLVQQARRIGKGDFSRLPEFKRNDEIAELAREMNAMADQLDEMRKNMAEERALRLETLEQLRHADRLKTVGQLTSGVIHEIGTPLTVIAGRAKMVATGEATGKEAMECARIAAEQTERVTRTVRQILNFARRGAKEKNLEDVASTARQMVTLLNPVAVKQGVYLNWTGMDRSARAVVDNSQMQQVIANLIINAIFASSSGGRIQVGVEIETQTNPERANAAPGQYVRLYVRDQGQGIPKEDMDRIFDPFFTTKKSGEGTGLGLAISRGLVRDHGGWMTVESEVGKGTCFAVFLPSKEEDKSHG